VSAHAAIHPYPLCSGKKKVNSIMHLVVLLRRAVFSYERYEPAANVYNSSIHTTKEHAHAGDCMYLLCGAVNV
jgi:hypothetical protein